MFVTLAVILVLAWLLGFGVFHVAGGLIHLLLLVALISIVWHFFSGGRRSSI
ncbi:MAG: lmo0937 family membrane protein [Gemmatimonadales bacterium]